MAGVGGFPGAIYLPENKQKAQLGLMLGQGLSEGLNQWNQSDALQKSAGLAPEQQLKYLQQRLGPEGAQFVSQMVELQKAKAAQQLIQSQTAHSQAETAREVTAGKIADVTLQMNQKSLAHADREQALKDQLDEARAEEARAATAGSYARAEEARAQIGRINEETAQLRQERESANKANALFSSLLSKGQQSAPQAPTESVPPSSQAAPSDSIVRTGAGAAGGPAGGQNGDEASAPKFAEALHNIAWAANSGGDVVRASGLPVASPEDVQSPTLEQQVKNLTPAQMFAVSALKTPAEKGEYLQQAWEKTHKFRVEPIQIAPGINAKAMVMPDGTTKVIPGTQAIKLQKLNQTEERATNGLSQLEQTLGTLEKLDQQGLAVGNRGGAMPEGATGDMIKRFGDQWALAHHQNIPFGSPEEAELARKYIYTISHSLVGITSLLSGLRQTDDLRHSMNDVIASAAEPLANRQDKIRAMRNQLFVTIKNMYEDGAAGGKEIPQDIRRLYKKYDLERPLESVMEDFTGEKADGRVAGPAPAKTAATKPGDDMVSVGGVRISRKQAEQIAKEEGTTLDAIMDSEK